MHIEEVAVYIIYLKFSFVAFDECHATTEGQPYHNIMREFYFDFKKIKELP
jgi:ERCC4-related helicase